jgi:Leucine-rich repeat (LRR) protein
MDSDLSFESTTSNITFSFCLNLYSIASLDLRRNNLFGAIPSLLYNTGLEVLRVNSNAEVTGTIPTTISIMTSLRILDLGETNFGGIIPTAIYSLPNITYIDISYGEFKGGISELIGNINNTLTDLIVEGNQLTGPLPAALSSLGKLESLLIANNDLTGTIPVEGLCERRELGGGKFQHVSYDCGIVCSCCVEKCVV